MVMQHFGSVASSSVRNLTLEQLPLLLIINRIRSSNEVFSFIHGMSSISSASTLQRAYVIKRLVIAGNVSLDELMTSLIHAVDVFSNQIVIECKEEV